MPTTVLKRSLFKPRWTDGALNQRIMNWSPRSTVEETRAILRSLLDVTFVLLVENFQSGAYGVVLKTETSPLLGSILSAFTHPSLLGRYIAQRAWNAPAGVFPTHRMEARELFHHVSETAGVVLAINPCDSPLRLTASDCEHLAQGKLPILGVTRAATTPPSTPISGPALEIQPGMGLVPESIVTLLRLELIGLETVDFASLFTLGPIGGAALHLGIRFSGERSPETDRAIQKLQILLYKKCGSSVRIKVIMLEEPLNGEVRNRVEPFYSRYSIASRASY